MREIYQSFKKILPVPITFKILSAGITLILNIIITRVFNMHSPRGPLFVTWLVTFDCNASCRFCATHSLKNLHPENLSRERAIGIAHEIGAAGTWVVGFTGGEVFLWPHLFEVIKILKEYDIVVYIVTNGLLLKEKAQEIIESRLDYIVVSIDSDDAAEHNKLRNAPLLFENLIDGIEYLKGRRENGIPLIKSSIILSRISLPKIVKILDYLNQIVDAVSIQPIVHSYANSPHGRSDQSIDFLAYSPAERKIVEKELEKLINAYPSYNNLYFRSIPIYWFDPEKLIKRIKCWSPFMRLQIFPDGNVFHCTANPNYGAVGNLNRSSFMEIWNSPELIRQREEIRRHNNKCICWTQDSSFNAMLATIPLVNRLPVLNKRNY